MVSPSSRISLAKYLWVCSNKTALERVPPLGLVCPPSSDQSLPSVPKQQTLRIVYKSATVTAARFSISYYYTMLVTYTDKVSMCAKSTRSRHFSRNLYIFAGNDLRVQNQRFFEYHCNVRILKYMRQF